MLGALERLYVAWFPSLPHVSGAVTGARLLMASAALIVPTLLMGTTLPLVLRSSLVSGGKLGLRLGVLYASNTTGAIVGTLVSGLWLIPAYGISRTFLVAAALNGAVALCALMLSTRMWREPSGSPRELEAKASSASSDTAGLSSRARLAVLITFAISGFVSIGAEVVWFRVAVLIIRPTVYAFAVMLATILAGIAIGSYLISPRLSRGAQGLSGPGIRALAVLEFLIAVAIVLSVAALQLGPDLARRAQPVLSRVMPAYLPFLVVHSMLMLFPSALLMGVAFPIGARLWTRSGPEGSGAGDVGRFYAVNVCGGIAGSLVAGFLLLPLIGSRGTLLVLGALTAAAATWLLLTDPAKNRTTLIVAGLALFVAACAYTPDPFDVFLRQRFPGQRVIWREEGVQSTVSVHESGNLRSLHLDGNHQASTSGGTVAVHRRIGGIGVAIHPDPRATLVIGLGGGATAGAVSRFPFAQVEVVELSEAVVKAAPFFSSINNDLLKRPNVHVRVDDGRNFLMLGPAEVRCRHGGHHPPDSRRRGQRVLAGVLQARQRCARRRWDRGAVGGGNRAGVQVDRADVPQRLSAHDALGGRLVDGRLAIGRSGSRRPISTGSSPCRKRAPRCRSSAIRASRRWCRSIGRGPRSSAPWSGPAPSSPTTARSSSISFRSTAQGTIDLSGLRPDSRAILAPRP